MKHHTIRLGSPTIKIRSITVRVPKPRREPTPAELLRELIRARRPSTVELRRRLDATKRPRPPG